MENKKIKLKEPNYSFIILFLFRAGLLVLIFGVICFGLGIYLNKDGDAFIILGYRFVIAGIISVMVSAILKYYPIIKFILQTKMKGKRQQSIG